MSEIREQLKTDETRTALRQSYFAKWDGTKFVHGVHAANLRTFERLVAERAAKNVKDSPLTGQMVELIAGFDADQKKWAEGMLK